MRRCQTRRRREGRNRISHSGSGKVNEGVDATESIVGSGEERGCVLVRYYLLPSRKKVRCKFIYVKDREHYMTLQDNR